MRSNNTIDTSKIDRFYNGIVREFDNHEDIFGKIDDFRSLIQSSEEREDGYVISTKISNLGIYFQKELFEKLFYSTYDVLNFDSNPGELVIGNDIYIELYLPDSFYSPENIDTIYKEYDKVFIFIKGRGETYYYSKVIPYFISTLKNRFVNKNILEEKEFNFYDFFRPIEGLVIIDKHDIPENKFKNLSKNLKFQITKRYGLIPIEEGQLTSKFNLSIKNSEIKNVTSKTTSAIDHYLKGLRTTNIFYQFLNFYQVIEHYCVAYSLKHLTKKIRKEESYQVYNEIKSKIKKEEYVISLAVSHLLIDYEDALKTNLTELNQSNSVQNLISKLNEVSPDYSIKNFNNWQDNYGENFGRLIYKVRNEIVHTKRKEDILEDLALHYPNLLQYIVKVLKNMSEKAIEEDLGI